MSGIRKLAGVDIMAMDRKAAAAAKSKTKKKAPKMKAA